MSRHVIEAADGSRHVIEVPDGPQVGGSATPTPQAPPAPQKTYQRAGGYGPVMAGVADAGIRGALGIKQFFGGLSDEDKAVLRELQAEKEADPEGGWRTTGEVGANIAATLVPGAKAAGALGKTRAALALGRAAPAATSAVTSGATEALLAPGEGDTFGEQMASKGTQAAKAAALGGAVTGGLGALARPFTPTASAQKLMDQGVYPTLAQGAQGKTGQFVGRLTSGVFPTQKRESREIVQAALKRILPDVPESMFPKTTADVARMMEDVGNEYGEKFAGKKFTMSSKDKGKIFTAAVQAAGPQPDVKEEVLLRLGKTGQALRSGNTVRLGPDKMMLERRYIQDQIDTLAGDPAAKTAEVRRGLIAAKKAFDTIVRNRQLTPEELADVKKLDARNFDAKRMLEATGSTASRKGIKATELVDAYRKMDPKGGKGFATADSAMQRDLLDPAMETVGDSLNQDQARQLMVALARAGGKSALGIGAWSAAPGIAAPLYGMSLASQTKQGARALMGDYAAQKKLADLLRSKGHYLGAAGSALSNQEGEY